MNHLLCNNVSIFAFPVNLIATAFLLTGIWVLHRYYAHTTAVKKLSGMPATLITTGLIVGMLIIEGIWALELFRTWIFIALELLLLVILGLVTLKKTTSLSRRNLLFLLNHAGLWVALAAALMGAPDREEYKIIAPLGETGYNAIDRNGTLHPLPFTVRLDRFELEYYPQPENARVPKRFCSTVTLTSRGESEQTAIEVNHPAHFRGYSLYQDGYDHSRGAASQYSVLLVVRDPWLWAVYTGIFMLLAGAVGLIIYGPLHKPRV